MGNEKWDDLDVVFLLGAGASKPLGLPTSSELLEGYREWFQGEVEKASFFDKLIHTYNVENYYRTGIPDLMSAKIKSKIGDLDIEYVFSVLETFKENFRNKENFLFSFNAMRTFIFANSGGNIFYINRDLNKDAKVRTDAHNIIRHHVENLLKLERVVNDIDTDLKRYIHSKLSKTLDQKYALPYYILLFDCFLNRKKLVIFTTNYDLSLENAFEEGGFPAEVYIGFESKNNRIVFVDNENKIINAIKRPPVENGIIKVNIFKIHGSLDWQKYNGKIVRGASVGISNPHDVYLIYPGVKNLENSGIDEVDSRVFRILHNIFKEVLKHSKVLISIGFAFRDKYIYQIIEQTLTENTALKIYSLNPSFPQDSYFPLLKSNFPDRVSHKKMKIVLDLKKAKPDFYLVDIETKQKFKSLCELNGLKNLNQAMDYSDLINQYLIDISNKLVEFSNHHGREKGKDSGGR